MCLSGCSSSAIFEADRLAVKHLEFGKNVTGFITGKKYQLHKEKGKHIKVKVE